MVKALTIPTPGESNVLSSVDESFTTVNLFPNPAKSFLYVKCASDWRFLDLVDINGEKIGAEYHIVAGGFEINTQLLEAGTYFIRLISSTGIQQSVQWLKI